MMNKLILITVLALAGMNNARSIGITLDRIQFSVGLDSIEVFPPFSRFRIDNEKYGLADQNYALDWRFTNTSDSASLAGSWYLIGGYVATTARVAFTLSEPVGFLLTGAIRQGEWAAESFTSLHASLAGFESNASNYDGVERDINFGSLTGILAAGSHVFDVNGLATATESTSNVRLLLTPVAAPDGGSTLMLLGLALGVIGILRLPKALA